MSYRRKNKNTFKQTTTINILWLGLLVVVLLLSGFTVGYQVHAITLTYSTVIESGSMVDTASYVIFRDGSTYYAKNGLTGAIDYSGTDIGELINDCIDSLEDIYVQLPNPEASWVWAKTGKIFLTESNYTLTSAIHIPVGSVINIEGVSSNQENINNGMSGGTQIICNIAGTSFVCDTSYDGISDVDGTQLYLTHIQFLQNVNLTSATTPVLNLDGMARGKLDDVQVVKKSSINPYIDGVGIRCYQFEDTGGYTEWNQVQVVGFSTGLNVSINHWLNLQQGIAKCETGIVWRVVMGDNFYNLHMQEVDFPFYLYAGFGEYEVASIYGLYLEGCGYSSTTPKWICDDEWQGMIHIYQTNVHACGSNLWNWNMGWSWWYEDVFIQADSPNFPAPSQPTGITSGLNFSNGNPQTVQMHIMSNNSDISAIYINGILTNVIDGVFLLKPADHCSITYSNNDPYVTFIAFSASRYVGNDP